MNSLSRRSFINKLVFGRTPVVESPAAHTLVCIFLRGAADTLNMLVPYGDELYYKSRPNLAIAPPTAKTTDAAVKLNDFYAFHPRMQPLLSCFNEGRLGIVQAVGTDNPTGSHFEAQDQIEHGEGFTGTPNVGGGWLARHLRSRTGGAADSPLAAVAIGATIPEALRGAPAASAFESIDEIHVPDSFSRSPAVTQTLAAMYGAEVGILGQQGKETLELLGKVQGLRDKQYKPEPTAQYADDKLGRGMREVARLIKADVGLEVACLDFDGWDTHYFQGGAGGQQAGLIDSLSKGLAAFDADMTKHRSKVTTVVLTEFGRRLYENASTGTDHGRGFAMFALGEQINGGRIIGEWPGFADELLPGPGGMQVRVDYRSVLSEILAGPVSNRSIDKVFPGFTPKPVGLVRKRVA